MRERVVKSIMDQRVFEFQNPFSGAQPRFQFLWIAGLDQIVVGPGRQTSGNVFFGAFRSKKNYVDVWVFGATADFAANTYPIEVRHERIEQRQPRAIGTQETFQSGASVVRFKDIITGPKQRLFQKMTRVRVILSDEDSHGATPEAGLCNLRTTKTVKTFESVHFNGGFKLMPGGPKRI
jgi:hypothetical protein